jgi:ABC-2 type transport system ATP-binding protein
VISVAHLTRTFGPFVALDDVSFTIERGEVVGVLGPNGAGKTTTLRILAGYLPASSGSARVAGFDVLRESLEVRRRIGYLPESVPLYREHRVVEMLDFQGRLHGLTASERKQRIPRVLERVGLADRSRDLIGSLSRGLRQRVGLAVALLPEPEVLILDEPTSGLDPLQRIEVRNIVRDLAERHTILLSSHILPEVEAVCPRVIILHKGRIAADGTREELVAKLARSSHVRLEAVIGSDVGAALRLLRCIGGVRDVIDRGRRGIHHELDIECDSDLREEVGALAAQRGWALRELSWRRPTLEELFARIALSLGDEPASEAHGDSTRAHTPISASIARSGAATQARTQLANASNATGASVPENLALAGVKRPTSSPGVAAASPTVSTAEAPARGASAAAPGAASNKIVYNLNPFDRGATRDLGKPKAVEGANTVALDLPSASIADSSACSEAAHPTPEIRASAPAPDRQRVDDEPRT